MVLFQLKMAIPTGRLVDFCRPAVVLNLKQPAEIPPPKNKNRQQPFKILGLQEKNTSFLKL
jgi:hypothetical protein